MKLANIPLGPAILGLVLGGQMESALSNSLSVSGGSWLVFVDIKNHPISAVMIVVAGLMWVVPIVRHLRSRTQEEV
jgi:putative tricarboxylic transport membrane protein